MKAQVILKKKNNILSYIIILICYANRVVRLFSTFSPCTFVSNPMEKREVTINPLGDGDFFHASAAKALGIKTQGLDSRLSTLDPRYSTLDLRPSIKTYTPINTIFVVLTPNSRPPF